MLSRRLDFALGTGLPVRDDALGVKLSEPTLGHIREATAFSSASSFTVRLKADTQTGAGGFRKPLERAR
jgi:hypothetical protein